jgi:hypothetical protein
MQAQGGVMNVLFRSPARGERLALWLVTAVALCGVTVAVIAMLFFVQSLEDMDRQLMDSFRPQSHDASR